MFAILGTSLVLWLSVLVGIRLWVRLLRSGRGRLADAPPVVGG
jgi:hypothetical protein